MASISVDSKGLRRVLFVAKDGNRKTLYLGDVTQKMAEGVKVRVEQLVASTITGHPVEDTTSRWLTGLDSTMLNKLATAGLIPKREMAKLERSSTAISMAGPMRSRTR